MNRSALKRAWGSDQAERARGKALVELGSILELGPSRAGPWSSSGSKIGLRDRALVELGGRARGRARGRAVGGARRRSSGRAQGPAAELRRSEEPVGGARRSSEAGSGPAEPEGRARSRVGLGGRIGTRVGSGSDPEVRIGSGGALIGPGGPDRARRSVRVRRIPDRARVGPGGRIGTLSLIHI